MVVNWVITILLSTELPGAPPHLRLPTQILCRLANQGIDALKIAAPPMGAIQAEDVCPRLAAAVGTLKHARFGRCRCSPQATCNLKYCNYVGFWFPILFLKLPCVESSHQVINQKLRNSNNTNFNILRFLVNFRVHSAATKAGLDHLGDHGFTPGGRPQAGHNLAKCFKPNICEKIWFLNLSYKTTCKSL